MIVYEKDFFIIFLLTFYVTCFGQNSGPLKFLGIPIDGTEAQFVANLKAKGFTYNTVYESYKGQFNGKPVDVFIHTNHNLVDRVYVAFPYMTEESIRVEFNRLLAQFNDTGKYMDLSMNEEIPADDDISYEITVNNKRYQASFNYFDSERDLISFANSLFDGFSEFFSEEQLVKLKEYFVKVMSLSKEQKKVFQREIMEKIGLIGFIESNPEKAFEFYATFVNVMRSLADGDIWFMIQEYNGRYRIGLYYDNPHNQAHGEDL